MADSSLIDDAVINHLAADATLIGLCPHGVHWGVAPAGATKFVVVSLFDHDDTGGLDDADLYERPVYLVKAVVLASAATVALNAAARIHTLLHNAAIDLSAAGYTLMTLRRIARVRYPEIDPVEKASRWQHCGGQYELWASPN